MGNVFIPSKNPHSERHQDKWTDTEQSHLQEGRGVRGCRRTEAQDMVHLLGGRERDNLLEGRKMLHLLEGRETILL